jgi:hypothetical protein
MFVASTLYIALGVGKLMLSPYVIMLLSTVPLLTSALDAERSASRSSRFTVEVRGPRYPLDRRLDGCPRR